MDYCREHAPDSSVLVGEPCSSCPEEDVKSTYHIDAGTPGKGLPAGYAYKVHLCRDCFLRSPFCSDRVRAKIVIEHLVLAEIQRLDISPHRIWRSDPTAWDCPILPGLEYKLDMCWVFDTSHEVIYETSGTCRLNAGEVGALVAFENDEGGAEVHSKSRHVPDDQREAEVRKVFAPASVTFIRASMAAKDIHKDAHRDDIFFQRVQHGDSHEFTYEVIPGRQEAFGRRVRTILEALEEARTNNLLGKGGYTKRIGY